jgi:hypothetical protein
VIALAEGGVAIVGVTCAKPIFAPNTASVMERQILDNIYPPPNPLSKSSRPGEFFVLLKAIKKLFPTGQLFGLFHECFLLRNL